MACRCIVHPEEKRFCAKPEIGSPAAYARMVRDESARRADLINHTGITAE